MCHRHDMFPVVEFGLENEHMGSLTSLRCVRNNMAATMIHSWETPNTCPCQPGGGGRWYSVSTAEVKGRGRLLDHTGSV